MTDTYSPEFNQSASGGHPHDLLARLYREIGISAVAAALEVSQFPDAQSEAATSAEAARDGWLPLGEDLAA